MFKYRRKYPAAEISEVNAMTRSSRLLGFVSLLLLFAVVPLLGHHSASSVYNPNKKITLKGTVTKILWANPHIAIYFDAPNQAGKIVNWELGDGQAPNGLYRKGWRKDDLKVGDVIIVTGATTAWDGSPHIGGGIITLAATGKKVFTGSKDDGL
jgi:hypothetical protein